MSKSDTPRTDELNHAEAHELSLMRIQESNLARCYLALELKVEKLAACQRRCAELEKDAARWNHSVGHGFPVRNQTASTVANTWVAHPGMHLGATPQEAIDAALTAQEPSK